MQKKRVRLFLERIFFEMESELHGQLCDFDKNISFDLIKNKLTSPLNDKLWFENIEIVKHFLFRT